MRADFKISMRSNVSSKLSASSKPMSHVHDKTVQKHQLEMRRTASYLHPEHDLVKALAPNEEVVLQYQRARFISHQHHEDKLLTADETCTIHIEESTLDPAKED